ncbi:cellulose hydrolase [Sporothrix schenckii 1099-18]|uniref:Cellulose hydrolase n=1 Tax=Sporothrix schenckii 1099-18 TaxID=1397361 RepID=A0A0F2M924_SPOSC|nr:cellulose hydrolase [Sporothrix schenckii 1099-18]KJR86137.1 cellulose hydrolase [Sporothrix schenckii 1099-18]
MSASALARLLVLAAAARACSASALGHRPSARVVVDTSVQYQEVDGLGASQAFQRAEDVFGKYGLSPAHQADVLDLLYSLEKGGAGFAILRNGIGSSNSSTSNLMNSIEPVSPGSPHAAPHYTWDGYDSAQFPLAQQARARGLATLYGNAWSAPGFMKTNDDENNGGYLCGVTGAVCASGDWKQAYADYLVQWVRFYEEHGVKVNKLGFLNEPQLAASYAGMLSNGTQAADFIRVLAKTIRQARLDVGITCCDGIGWDDQEAMMAGLQAGPDPAEQYLDVVTGHGYDSAPTYPLSTTKKTWLSEWADLAGGFTPTVFYDVDGPGEGLRWARYVQTAFVDANVSGFLYWIGAENSTTNSGLINLINDTIVPSKRFWSMAQFSRFARPGARRVEATSSARLLYTSAFRNTDGKIATQVINNDTTAYDVTLSLKGATWHAKKMVPYLTDNANDLTARKAVVAAHDGTFKTTVPARSLVTFLV